VVFRPTIVVPACLVASLLAPAGASGAGQAGNPQVLVVFQNVARAPARMVEEAQAEVSRLFKDIGVEIVWAAEMPVDYRNVRMLALTHLEPSPNAVSGAVLGFTQTIPEGRGTRAYVFFSRLIRMAHKFSVMTDKLLAVAMAHELGHTLLPDASHAATGIMRAPWDYFDLRAASKGELHFSKDSAVLIRQRAAGR
jgi:hypothetical protein